MSASFPPLDNIQVIVIVWRLRGNIIRTAPCWVVGHNVHSQQHTHVSSFYSSSSLGLSYWDPYAMHRGGCLELYYYNMVEWCWWDSSLIWKTNWLPSVLWHCWFGHPAPLYLRTLWRYTNAVIIIWPVKIVPYMTYNVFDGTLNLAQSIHHLLYCLQNTLSARWLTHCGNDPRSSVSVFCSTSRVTSRCCVVCDWQVMSACSDVLSWSLQCLDFSEAVHWQGNWLTLLVAYHSFADLVSKSFLYVHDNPDSWLWLSKRSLIITDPPMPCVSLNSQVSAFKQLLKRCVSYLLLLDCVIMVRCCLRAVCCFVSLFLSDCYGCIPCLHHSGGHQCT